MSGFAEEQANARSTFEALVENEQYLLNDLADQRDWGANDLLVAFEVIRELRAELAAARADAMVANERAIAIARLVAL